MAESIAIERRVLEGTLRRIAQLHTAARFIKWVFNRCVVEGCDIEGGEVQDKLAELDIIEARPAPPGSREAEDWGEGAVLYYLRPEWRSLLNE